ncbi:unnamed protein product [Psylliodes chrysocephalus]|uniref:cellulase n=1 Tax=Psylliodes chrysocephalus TaxID=3402493 RepID=A0A9P0DB15_9CUCU|nr:unnamed protein product [Psylliodes chrysocephala]
MKIALASVFLLAAYASAFGVLEEIEEIRPVVGGISGTGTTSRYWDCCKPTCAWPGNVKYKKPVKACKADGSNANDPENQSGCVGGQSYMCTNQSGYVKNNTLAYGFVAAKFVNAGGRNMCCSCVMFTFNTKYPSPLNGKKMLVQVTNTGEDDPDADHNLFDIAMPGSGVGYYTKGCPGQWHNDVSVWGDQYGGVNSEAECYKLPKPLQKPCAFRFQWMSGYSNPDVSFYEVTCPKELINISGCSPVGY